jgi:hypothetical protein
MARWCEKRRDEYGNRHDEPKRYVPPGHMCIQEVSPNFRSLCCSDGLTVYCVTHDGAETYCTEDGGKAVERFMQQFGELISGKGWERRGTAVISAFYNR